MAQYPPSIQKLIETFAHLPGLGPKTAERIIFYLVKKNQGYINDLTDNIQKLRKDIKVCGQCFNIGSSDPCEICADPKRDATTLCVVSEPQDIMVIEKSGEYHGHYHVLGGVLNPVENITPESLTIKDLFNRIHKSAPKITEVILATNPDLEGESTAMYLSRKLKPTKIKITRLAKGLPMGATIEYADEVTISNALKGRSEL